MPIRTIDECFYHIQNGANIKQGDVDGGYPITRIETTSNDTFNRDRMGYAGITDLSKYESYILEDGDLLMSHINSVQYLGRTVLYKRVDGEKIIHGMNLLRLKANRDIIIPDYARYAFYSYPFRSQLANITKKSVNQASFAVKDLKRIKLNVPDLSIQAKIVSTFDKLQSIITLRKQQLAKLDELVKARFVELFGGDTAKYATIPLKDCCAGITGGGTPSMKHPEYYGGDIPFIKSGDVKDDRVSKGALTLTDIALKETTAKLLPKDTIIVVVRSAALLHEFHIAVIDNPVVINQDLKAITPTEQFSAIFLMWAIKMKEHIILGKVQTMLTSHIRMDDFLFLDIPVPPIDLQNEFAAFVERVDKSKFDD